jgi:hypothetical protein
MEPFFKHFIETGETDIPPGCPFVQRKFKELEKKEGETVH